MISFIGHDIKQGANVTKFAWEKYKNKFSLNMFAANSRKLISPYSTFHKLKRTIYSKMRFVRVLL